MKIIGSIIALIGLVAIASGVLFLVYSQGGFGNYYVQFREGVDKYNPETKEMLYEIRASHWYKFDIVRYEYYYGKTQPQIDSLKIYEKKIGEEYFKQLKSKK